MYSTIEASKQAGISKNTLLRWIAEGRVADVERDWRGWRVWSDEDIRRVKAFRDGFHPRSGPRPKRRVASKTDHARQAAQGMAQYGRACARGGRGVS